MTQSSKPREGEYSMRVVTRLTGLAADTIRAWERRYGAVEPPRTEGNTRRYRAADVRRLSLLKEATARGHRIGDIARLSEEELLGLTEAETALAAETRPHPADGDGTDEAYERVRKDYLAAIGRYETRRAGELLARASAVFGPRELVVDVVLPIMRATGDLWQAGQLSVAQEHLVSMQARSLFDTLFRLSSPHPGAPRLVASTPAGQLHEFGALGGAMLAAMRGFDVLYLGADVPEKDLVEAAERSGAAVVLLSVVRRGTTQETAALAASIERLAAEVETWVGTGGDHPIVPLVSKARLFHRFEDLDVALADRLR